MVRHRAVLVNARRVDIPSYLVKVGDVIQISSARKGEAARAKENLERTKDTPRPTWTQVDTNQLSGVIVRSPEKEDIGLPIQEQLIVELYSK